MSHNNKTANSGNAEEVKWSDGPDDCSVYPSRLFILSVEQIKNTKLIRLFKTAVTFDTNVNDAVIFVLSPL